MRLRLDLNLSVVMSHHTDDYKPRGRGWVRSSSPILFRTRSNAEKYICSYVLDEVLEKARDLREIPEAVRHYFYENEETENLEIVEKYKNDYSILDELREHILKGEYCQYRLTWDLHQLKFEDEEEDE